MFTFKAKHFDLSYLPRHNTPGVLRDMHRKGSRCFLNRRPMLALKVYLVSLKVYLVNLKQSSWLERVPRHFRHHFV